MDTSAELSGAVRRFQKGQREAFDDIYKMSYGYLYVCLSRLVKDEDITKDMLQETYLEICKSIGQLNQPERFLSWAARIACRKYIAWLKKERRLPVAEGGQAEGCLEEMAENEKFLPETILQNKEKQLLLREIIDDLPPMQRLCIIAFYYNGLTLQQIAEELELPLNTVKSHLNRGKKRIKAAVLELEEKKGTRLYAVAPFFLLLIGIEAEACEVPKMSRKLAESAEGREASKAPDAEEAQGGGSQGRPAGNEPAGTKPAKLFSAGGKSATMAIMACVAAGAAALALLHPWTGGMPLEDGTEQANDSGASKKDAWSGEKDDQAGDSASGEVPLESAYEVSLLDYLNLHDYYPWLKPDKVPELATNDFLFVYTGVTDKDEDAYIVYLGDNIVGSVAQFILYNGETGERLVKPYIDEKGRRAIDTKSWIMQTSTSPFSGWFRVCIDRTNENYDPKNIVIAQMTNSPDDAHTNLSEEIECANFVWAYRPKGTLEDVQNRINANCASFVFLPDGNVWWIHAVSYYRNSQESQERKEKYYQVQSLTGDTLEHLLEEFQPHMKLGRISYGGGEPGGPSDIAVDVGHSYNIDLSEVDEKDAEQGIIGPFVITSDEFAPVAYVLGYDDGEKVWYFW